MRSSRSVTGLWVRPSDGAADAEKKARVSPWGEREPGGVDASTPGMWAWSLGLKHWLDPLIQFSIAAKSLLVDLVHLGIGLDGVGHGGGEMVENLGSHQLVHGSLAGGGEAVVAHLEPRHGPRRGETILLGAREEHVHLFESGTGRRLASRAARGRVPVVA